MVTAQYGIPPSPVTVIFNANTGGATPPVAPQTLVVQTGGQPVTGGWGWVWLMAAGGLLATGWGLGRFRLPVLRG